MTLDIGEHHFQLNCTDGLADTGRPGFRTTLPPVFDEMTRQKIAIGQQYAVVELGADHVIEVDRHWIAYSIQHVAFSIVPKPSRVDTLF